MIVTSTIRKQKDNNVSAMVTGPALIPEVWRQDKASIRFALTAPLCLRIRSTNRLPLPRNSAPRGS